MDQEVGKNNLTEGPVVSRRAVLQILATFGVLGGGMFLTLAPGAETAELSQETVKRVAELAGVELTEARVKELAPAVKGIHAEISKLRELDLSDIDPVTIFSLEKEKW